ncbi:MAG: hypothetical protein ACEQSA_04880 [Weeksellaceae bacterium]
MDTLIGNTNAFRKELELSAQGQTTSLPYIKHRLTQASIVPKNDIFQAIVIGGSYFQKARIKNVQSNLQILQYDTGDQPVFDTKETLFAFIEQHLEPEVTVVALNFAYPMTPVTRGDLLDGILVRGTKENIFAGLTGKAVGEEFEKYIQEKQGRSIRVACANDTICLLLSGLMHHTWYNLAAGIVGTGLNFAIFTDKHTAVNLETSNFNKFTPSAAGRAIDDASTKQGTSLYEKEIAGAYLYKHFNYLAKERNLDVEEIKSTKLIDVLAKDTNPEIANTAKEVIQHSAELVAAQVAGIMQFCQRDLTFIMQGSLYWKGVGYKETVEKLVTELCPQYTASYEQVLHSDLYGAAKLVA